MRTVVIGASSGLGRCIGVDRGRRGDHVALLARRADRVHAAAAEAGAGAIGIACDVTDELACRAALADAADHMGGIDALVYCAGIGRIEPVETVTAATWRSVLDTNVVGASIVTAAALPHLEASGGIAVYLSSVSASVGRPWPGFGAYIVSKAALDRLIEVYRVEHPGIGFTRVVVGDTAGGEGPGATGFADDWDMEQATRFMPVWQQRGYFTGSLMPVEALLEGVDFLLRTRAAVPTIWLTPRQRQEPDVADAADGLRQQRSTNTTT